MHELPFLFNEQNGQQRHELKFHSIQSNTKFAYYATDLSHIYDSI